MLEGLISSLGLINLVLIIVGVALLIVVILLMSYFRVLVAIANFTNPNAKFRALGTPFVKEEDMSQLLESRNLNEIYSRIRDKGYDIPKDANIDIQKVERELEKNTLKLVKKAYRNSPLETKPFVEAWLTRYDVKMVKKIIKNMSKAEEDRDSEIDEEFMKEIWPVRIIDEEMIDELSSARNLQEVLTLLKETELKKVLEKREWEEKSFELDVALDRFVADKLRRSVMKVESEQRTAIKYFFGKYTDLINLKIIIRGIREDIDNDLLKDALLPPGRELPEWKLEQMVDSKDLEEALVELEGTSYEEIRKEGISKSHFELERTLEMELLSLSSEIMSQNVLTVGPIIKFVVGKDIELRNIRILIRGVKEGIDPERIKNMMVLEEH